MPLDVVDVWANGRVVVVVVSCGPGSGREWRGVGGRVSGWADGWECRAPERAAYACAQSPDMDDENI